MNQVLQFILSSRRETSLVQCRPFDSSRSISHCNGYTQGGEIVFSESSSSLSWLRAKTTHEPGSLGKSRLLLHNDVLQACVIGQESERSYCSLVRDGITRIVSSFRAGRSLIKLGYLMPCAPEAGPSMQTGKRAARRTPPTRALGLLGTFFVQKAGRGSVGKGHSGDVRIFVNGDGVWGLHASALSPVDRGNCVESGESACWCEERDVSIKLLQLPISDT